ncbi:MAG: hypothetical protein V3S36_09840 [Acidiferrobacterales bacterium]|jgi:hypothetical protein
MASHVEQVYKELADEHESIMRLVDRIQQHGTVLHLVPLLEELHTVLILCKACTSTSARSTSLRKRYCANDTCSAHGGRTGAT